MKKISEISFIRSVCAVGIIIYHFLGSSRSGIEFLHSFKNGQLGSVYVTVFFVISGFVLYYNYPKLTSLKEYYFKRFIAIFPMFWIAYIFCYVDAVFYTGDLFYHDQPWCLIFSVLGIDGYLWDFVPHYYFLGEWFLGAIIILYLIYPLINKLFNWNNIITGIILIALFLWRLNANLPMHAIRSIIACELSFYVGMMLCKYKEQILSSSISFTISASLFVILLFVDFRRFINEYLLTMIFGWCLFILLFGIARIIMKNNKVKSFFLRFGNLSYPIFLVQHQVVDRIMGYQNYYEVVPTLIMLLITIIFTIVCAWVLSVVTREVINLFRNTFSKKASHSL